MTGGSGLGRVWPIMTMPQPLVDSKALDALYRQVGVNEGVRLGEAWLLYQLALQVPQGGQAAEIGSWMGRSTIALARGLMPQAATLHTIDDHSGLPGNPLTGDQARQIFFANLEAGGVRQVVNHHAKSSDAMAPEWRQPLDLLFIDGCHDYDFAKRDTINYAPHVKPGGVVAFHDVVMPGVFQAIQEWGEERDPAFDGVVRRGNVVAFRVAVSGDPASRRSRRKAMLAMVRAATWRIPEPLLAKIGHKWGQSLGRRLLRRWEWPLPG